jgi:ABC-type nitrate/sulfonate/bicarbonate transport system substrate-binding protein
LIETTPAFSYLPLYALEHDTAPARNLTIHETDVTGGGVANQEFTGGQGDLLIAGADSPVRLTQTGAASVTVIAAIQGYDPWVIVSKAGSPYTTWASLKGKSIGITSAGGQTDVVIRQQLVQAGVSISSVHLVALGSTPALLAALAKGSVQAVPTQAPYLQQEQAAGSIQILDDLRTQTYPSAVVTARTSAVEKNPAPYCTFIAALKDSMQKIFTDPAYATKEATAGFGVSTSPALIQTELGLYIKSSWQQNAEFTQAQYDTLKTVLTQSGEISATNYPTYQTLTEHAPSCP